jgi:hypothetical protein
VTGEKLRENGAQTMPHPSDQFRKPFKVPTNRSSSVHFKKL